MNLEQKIEIYKQAANLLMSKSYQVHELVMLANVTNYLAQEIEAHDQAAAQANNDSGTESEAPVL